MTVTVCAEQPLTELDEGIDEGVGKIAGLVLGGRLVVGTLEGLEGGGGKEAEGDGVVELVVDSGEIDDVDEFDSGGAAGVEVVRFDEVLGVGVGVILVNGNGEGVEVNRLDEISELGLGIVVVIADGEGVKVDRLDEVLEFKVGIVLVSKDGEGIEVN